jgi:hypothetical protein
LLILYGLSAVTALKWRWKAEMRSAAIDASASTLIDVVTFSRIQQMVTPIREIAVPGGGDVAQHPALRTLNDAVEQFAFVGARECGDGGGPLHEAQHAYQASSSSSVTGATEKPEP